MTDEMHVGAIRAALQQALAAELAWQQAEDALAKTIGAAREAGLDVVQYTRESYRAFNRASRKVRITRPASAPILYDGPL
jgi:hypothetical protein